MSTENEIQAKINIKLPSASANGINASDHREVHEEIKNNLVFELDTLIGVGQYAGNATKLFVRDSSEGGIWVYTTETIPANSPQVIPATGKGSGSWVMMGVTPAQIPNFIKTHQVDGLEGVLTYQHANLEGALLIGGENSGQGLFSSGLFNSFDSETGTITFNYEVYDTVFLTYIKI